MMMKTALTSRQIPGTGVIWKICRE